MSGISWLVYHYADSGEIYQVTGVPGIYPSDGAQVDLAGNEIVRHLMKDDLESLGFQNPYSVHVRKLLERYRDGPIEAPCPQPIINGSQTRGL